MFAVVKLYDQVPEYGVPLMLIDQVPAPLLNDALLPVTTRENETTDWLFAMLVDVGVTSVTVSVRVHVDRPENASG